MLENAMATERLNDKWFRFIGVPVIGLMGHIIFFNRNDTGPERFGFLTIYILSIMETVILWEGNRLIILYFRKAYGGLQHTKQRIAFTLIVCTLFTIILRSLNIFIYDKTALWGYHFPLEGYLHSVFVALLFVVIIAGIYEAIYYFRMWKRTTLEAESLRAENLQTELDLLKVQLNPHFLFNAFGSLSSLIDEDPLRAKAFLEQLSVVYRLRYGGREAKAGSPSCKIL
jgi:amino acid permease